MDKEPVLNHRDLIDTLEIHPGNLPIVVTVPHDGLITKIGEVFLPRNLKTYPRDVGVLSIAKDIYYLINQGTGNSVNLLAQRIHRAHLTTQIQQYFEKELVGRLLELSKQYQPLLYLDLHGFTRQPVFGNFDVILGTNHRQTLTGTDIDYTFANYLERLGYKTYTPSEHPRPGELYGATCPHTLTYKISQLSLPNFVALQIEISNKFRILTNQEKGKLLSTSIGNFLTEYCQLR